MVVEEFVRIDDIGEEPLAWTRPNFFALRYELAGSAGVVERLSVSGIGADRQIVLETGEGAWRFELFPLDRRIVPVYRGDNPDPIAEYDRGNPVQVRFTSGTQYEFRVESPLKTVLVNGEQQTVFTLEQVEAFPKWRVEIKVEPGARELSDLPVLWGAACCSLVFAKVAGPAASAAGSAAE